MAEIRTGEYSLYRSNLLDAHRDLKVVLWDCGPEGPVAPVAPTLPKGREGEPEYDLAKIQFARKLEAYRQALVQWEIDTVVFKDWATRNGGPVEQMFWSCDASDALQNDARSVKEGRQARRRWFVSARTRGCERLPNGGLPEGFKPGHGHQANIERQIAGQADLLAAKAADPMFGQGVS
jgi:hypothetical protein